MALDNEGSSNGGDGNGAFAPDNFDPRPSDLLGDEKLSPNTSTAIIRTSDRILFKRCRRAWAWGSHLRGNLGAYSAQSPLWLGSGFHFALEDYHSTNIYKHPATALRAYAIATYRKGGRTALPATWEEDLNLGQQMLHYYADHWLTNREKLTTFVYNGIPQVEVNFRIEIPYDASTYGHHNVIYSGTLDRVVVDEHDQLWIVEYKTAKIVQTSHFETDPQVTTYCWAASLLYPNHKVAGVIYQQHRKTLPDKPIMLASGKLSTNKNQSTDYYMYRKALQDIYGNERNAPINMVDCLNHFATLEDIEANKFIRRDRIYRNEHQAQAEAEKIMLEITDMLNPNLLLYPNPTRECTYCTFKGPCISLDDGGDYEQEIEIFTKPRELTYDGWRAKLPSLEELQTTKPYSFE